LRLRCGPMTPDFGVDDDVAGGFSASSALNPLVDLGGEGRIAGPAGPVAGPPVAARAGPQHRITTPCVGAGRSDWTARLVNGFVNETRRHCMYGVERGVMA
jgi:hypothetical protein